MKYGTKMTTGAILMAFVAAAPLAVGAADEKAQTTTQAAETMVSDSWLTSKTKIALFADQRVKGTQISVDTAKGVVHLRGKVDSAEAKSAASDVAQGIEGMKSVKNDLQVVAPAARQAGDVNDKDIAKDVETRPGKDSQLKKGDVRADAGVVAWTGQVATIGASAKASEMARGVHGVKSVKNELAFAK